MPLASIPSVPDSFSGNPLPNDLWSRSLLAPITDSPMSTMSLHEVQTLSLSVKNVSVLGINLSLSLAVSLPVRVLNVFVNMSV